jgi:thioredoxin reductase
MQIKKISTVYDVVIIGSGAGGGMSGYMLAGIQDLGYQGNAPGKWEGVPQHVLKKYGLENV